MRTWPDVRLLYVDIAQQQLRLPVQPVAIAVVIAAAATVMIVIRPTPRQAALAEVVEAVAEDPAAAQSPAGQNRGLPGTGTGSEKGENRAYLDVCPG
ncbi:hypothetical protein HI359_004839 [Escherichia coli]|uniref:hypothetical protein n=2 Tax=Escherichia coli TaxID=562 RepID=UPI0010B6C0A7|nr:hypothetical protein [Escherichia coli]EGE6597947.1 hypothetical protein [Escherichia coli]GCJ35553.1 hypothetical protein BvCmsL119A_04871 [Escherichia coli]GCJ55162.1 hypothetical protein BvCmsC61A_05232 [Escherichia coli]